MSKSRIFTHSFKLPKMNFVAYIFLCELDCIFRLGIVTNFRSRSKKASKTIYQNLYCEISGKQTNEVNFLATLKNDNYLGNLSGIEMFTCELILTMSSENVLMNPKESTFSAARQACQCEHLEQILAITLSAKLF